MRLCNVDPGLIDPVYYWGVPGFRGDLSLLEGNTPILVNIVNHFWVCPTLVHFTPHMGLLIPHISKQGFLNPGSTCRNKSRAPVRSLGSCFAGWAPWCNAQSSPEVKFRVDGCNLRLAASAFLQVGKRSASPGLFARNDSEHVSKHRENE